MHKGKNNSILNIVTGIIVTGITVTGITMTGVPRMTGDADSTHTVSHRHTDRLVCWYY